MSKKSRGRNLAALGGLGLLAMKMAKGNRKDAAPIEDRMSSKKAESTAKKISDSISEDMRKRALADTDVSGIDRYAQETGIGTMRQPARSVFSAPDPDIGRGPTEAQIRSIEDRFSKGTLPPRKPGTFKKGGPVKKKSGGMVSKASKRADGIAKRGKTHCKIC
jgi:hypothetical protein